MSLLGKIHEMEQHRERMRDLVGPLNRHGIDETPWLAEVTTATRVPRGTTQPLDIVVQVGATGLGHDLAEESAEKADVVVQRLELVRPFARHDQRA